MFVDFKSRKKKIKAFNLKIKLDFRKTPEDVVKSTIRNSEYYNKF